MIGEIRCDHVTGLCKLRSVSTSSLLSPPPKKSEEEYALIKRKRWGGEGGGAMTETHSGCGQHFLFPPGPWLSILETQPLLSNFQVRRFIHYCLFFFFFFKDSSPTEAFPFKTKLFNWTEERVSGDSEGRRLNSVHFLYPLLS